MPRIAKPLNSDYHSKQRNISSAIYEHPKTPNAEVSFNIFRVRNFYSLMLPCIFFSQILGIFAHGFSSTNGIVKSRLLFAYCTLFLAFYMVPMNFILYSIDISGKIQFSSTPGALRSHFITIGHLYIFIACYVLHPHKGKVLQSLFELSSTLPTRNFSIIGVFIHVKDIGGFVFLIAHISYAFSGDFYRLLMVCLSMYSSIVVFLNDMMYVNSVYTLKMNFRDINDHFARMRDALVENEPHLLRRNYHEGKIASMLKEVKRLRERHTFISNVLEEMNSTFSWHLMGSFTLVFLRLTFVLYFFFLQQWDETDTNMEKQIWHGHLITPIIFNFTIMIIIVSACEVTSKEAANVGVFVHEIADGVTDKAIRKELEVFALQTFQRTNTFWARGSRIDATLITTIVSAITTYLLILVQFLINKAKKLCEN